MTAPDDVRARFEAWATERGLLIRRAAMTCGNARGPYDRSEVQSAWDAYRATHAGLSGEVRELVEAAKHMRENFRCVLDVNCKCDSGFIDRQTAEFDAALAKFTRQEKP